MPPTLKKKKIRGHIAFGLLVRHLSRLFVHLFVTLLCEGSMKIKLKIFRVVPLLQFWHFSNCLTS